MLRIRCWASLACACVMLTALARAEEGKKHDEKCQNVMILDSGTKPSVAIQKAKYETRCEGDQKAPPLLCDACAKKMYPQSAPVKPTAANQTQVYRCDKCHKLCWRDNGKECEHTDKEDCEYCKALEKQLKAMDERKLCPHCAAHTSVPSSATKPIVSQMQFKACPECEKSVMEKGKCNICEGAGVKCEACELAEKDAKKAKEKKSEKK